MSNSVVIKNIKQLAHNDLVICLTYNKNGSLLASSDKDKMIFIWETESYKILKKLDNHTLPVMLIVFSPFDLLASTSTHGKIIIYNSDYTLRQEI